MSTPLPWARHLTTLAAIGLALSGCGSKSPNHAEPADDPQPVTTTPAAPAMLVRELPGLLLGAGEINRLMGATAIEVVDDWSTMFGYNTPAGDCAGAWATAWLPVYTGSGWLGVRGRTAHEPGDTWDHIVWQAVVAFPLAADAADFYAKQAASWKTCDGRHVDERDLDQPDASDPNNVWTLDQPSDVDGLLSMVAIEDDEPTWSCQRALTVRNNVAVDVRACGFGVKTQAGAVASAIAAKVPVR
jgi:hypothetical protein